MSLYCVVVALRINTGDTRDTRPAVRDGDRARIQRGVGLLKQLVAEVGEQSVTGAEMLFLKAAAHLKLRELSSARNYAVYLLQHHEHIRDKAATLLEQVDDVAARDGRVGLTALGVAAGAVAVAGWLLFKRR